MEAHGWRLFVHPLFRAQLESLAKRVEKIASSDPGGYVSHPATKMLATINHYIRDAIPRNPNGPEFRQGNTLGPDNRHWYRARFHRRYRRSAASPPGTKSSSTPGLMTRAPCASPDRELAHMLSSRPCWRAASRQAPFGHYCELQRRGSRARTRRQSQRERKVTVLPG